MFMVDSYPYALSMSMMHAQPRRRRSNRPGSAQILANQDSRSPANKQPEI
jgi:hypothetical protein